VPDRRFCRDAEAAGPRRRVLGSHALAAGVVTKKQLRLYRRLLQNVYADPGLSSDHQLHARGAALVMPPAAALGGRSAAAWFGAPFASVVDPVVVVVPSESTWRGPRGVLVHRTRLGPDDLATVDDVIRVTSPLRTAWEVATLERVTTAVGLLDAMVRAGHVGRSDLRRLVDSHRGKWRHSRAATVIPLVDGPSLRRSRGSGSPVRGRVCRSRCRSTR